MNVLKKIEEGFLKTDIPDFKPGDSVQVQVRLKEADKERIQVFEGTVIRRRGSGTRATFTVRKVSYGVGVERTFPLYSPRLEKVEVVRHGKTRRAKLYYLRDLSSKASRLKEKRVDREEPPEEKAE